MKRQRRLARKIQKRNKRRCFDKFKKIWIVSWQSIRNEANEKRHEFATTENFAVYQTNRVDTFFAITELSNISEFMKIKEDGAWK